MSKVAAAKAHLQERMQHTPPPPTSTETQSLTIDPTQLDNAILAGLKDSRFGVWSTPAKIALLYLANTTPRFSISATVAKYVVTGLEKDYPELMRLIQDKLSS